MKRHSLYAVSSGVTGVNVSVQAEIVPQPDPDDERQPA
jgi:hypothetical protein